MYDYLMNIGSVIYICCYFPEIYSIFKNKNANIYNIPERVIMLTGTCFALSYSVLNKNQALLVNYVPMLFLDVLVLGLRLYYAHKNRKPYISNNVVGNVAIEDIEESSIG